MKYPVANKKFKIGIYNKYLFAYGGGEKYSGTIAEILSKNHEIDIISHQQIDKHIFSSRLNVNLDNANIIYLPQLLNDNEISKITKHYDLFINTTYLSTLASKAAKSILITFYPVELTANLNKETILKTPALKLKSMNYILMKLTQTTSGFIRLLKSNNILRFRTFKKIVSIEKQKGLSLLKSAERHLTTLFNNHRISRRYQLKTYTAICAISQYTQKGIRKYWNMESQILYPPIDTVFFKPLAKKKIILSVGRFFEGNHNKKHIPMITAFKSLYDSGLVDWQYHLVGGTIKTDIHQKYLEKVKNESKGYPIFIHTDVSFKELQRFYGEATVFWHGTGFGEDDNRNPDNFEHFGITTVEAMSAECIPIVFGMGGQLEIVIDNENGFLWKTINELIEKTRKTINDDILQAKLKINAVKTSERFNKSHFEEAFLKILNKNKIITG